MKHTFHFSSLCKLASICAFLNLLITDTALSQISYFEDFQSSTNCTIGICNAKAVTCIDNWSYYDPPYANVEDIAIFQYACYLTSSELSTLECRENGFSERGLWLQDKSHDGSPFDNFPDNARRYAILNPFYGQNPNSIYKLSFDFVPFPSEVASYVNVFGASTSLSSTSSTTFLGSSVDFFLQNSNDEYICSRSYVLFNGIENYCSYNSLTNYPYLILGLSSTPNPSPPGPGPDETYARGVLDNLNFCKILEHSVTQDCDKTCSYIKTFNNCTNTCIDETCRIDHLIEFFDGIEYISSATIALEYTQPYSNYLECFEIPENATSFIATAGIYLSEIEGFQYTCIEQAVNSACQDFDVFTTQTWDQDSPPPLERFKTLTIYSGITLTIDASEIIKFCQNGKLIIQPNARLNLYGKLTSDCPYGWDGIEVQGNGTINQFPNNSGVYAQGRLYCYPNSTIEHATTAVKLYGPDYDDAGGVIIAEGAFFTNNSRGLDFAPFHNYFPTISKQKFYKSSIRDCKFDINDDYVNPTLFTHHIKLNGVFGIPIYGTYFGFNRHIEEASLPKQFGVGIMAINSGFTVGATALSIIDEPCLPPCLEYNRSKFYGLGIGISVGKNGQNKPFRIYNSEFEKCFFGISNEGTSGATILFNDFNMGNVWELTEDENQVGISMTSYQQIGAIQENTFTRTSGNTDFALGIVANNLGEVNNPIRKNKFIGLNVGIEAFLRNAAENLLDHRGTYYICNENEDVTEFDFLISSTTNENFIRDYQGEITAIIPFAAGNTFSRTGNTTYGDFSNEGERDIQYYQYIGNAQEVLINYTDNNIHDQPVSENSCLPSYCLHPCIESSDFNNEILKFEDNTEDFQDAWIEENYILAAYYREKLDSNLNNIIRFIELDTLGFDRDSLRQWYSRTSSITGDLLLASDYYYAGAYSSALAILDSISEWHTLETDQVIDINRVKKIYSIISARSVYSLTSTDIDSLVLFSQGQGASYALARSTLSVLDSIFTPRYFIPGELNPRSSIENNNTDNPVPQVNVYPNPFSSLLIVELLPSNDQDIEIEILSLNGQVLFSTQLKTGANRISITEQNFLVGGMYFYRIKSQSRLISAGKLILIK